MANLLMKQKLPYIFFIFICYISAFSQEKKSSIHGIVSSQNGEPVPGVSVYVEHTSFITSTDPLGKYTLTLPAGNYTIHFNAIGYEKKYTAITLIENETKELNSSLSESLATELDEVEIKGKSALQQVRESAYNVVALDAKSQYNSTLNLADMLDKASGIKIRSTGGVGSNMAISLNGFTGRHIKLFMDGVPMEGFGSAFQLNNIPVSIADRIEVYKGVVPIEFGADAMGGVINIVTNQSSNSYLDASYSYGSFNTHKSNISLGHTTKKGFTVQFNAFQNYSDNDYKVKTNILNLATGNYSAQERWVRRFHDTYHNETIMAKVGFVNKSWADRLLLGVTLGQEKADIQSANIMKIVYGKRNRSGTTFLPSLYYEKKNLFTKGLGVRFTANYNRNYNQNNDTAARQYNWLGEYRETNSMGEASYSLAEFYNDNVSATTNLNYRITDKHSLSVNNVTTGFERKNKDKVAVEDEDSAADDIRKANRKNVLGVSYRYQHSSNWNANLFAKSYYQKVIGPIDISTTTTPNYSEKTETFSTTGYGVATTYFYKTLQFKASIEKAYRLPTDTELFGDEVLETGNITLKAENSMNYNLGVTLNKPFQAGNSLYVDANIYYRDTKDYIRRFIEQRYGTAGYNNIGAVHNTGLDTEVRYYYKNKFMVGGNLTYQDMRDKQRYRSNTGNVANLTYNDRIPNVPYLFGNADAAYYLHNLGGKGNVMSLGYSLNYVGKFYLYSESLGDPSLKKTLPEQLYHDFTMTYSFKNGKYNIAFEARNFTNTMLYDNFSLQKPGRSFSIKLRYFLMKRNNN